jgi:hypothetical protein
MKKSKKSKTTSVRRFSAEELSLLQELKSAVKRANQNMWLIGEQVGILKANGIPVVQQVDYIAESAQRLREYRKTAAAFAPKDRREDVGFCMHTIAARSASRLQLNPVDVIDVLVENNIETTRQATSFLAERIRKEKALLALFHAGQMTSQQNHLWHNCHMRDFRESLKEIEAGTVKLVIADPPYGAYGSNTNGNPVGQSAAGLACEGMDDESARALHVDLFRITGPLMMEGGCLIVCRPGGHADPPWLINAAEESGWVCRHAVSWRRGPGKLGNGVSPYTSGTERLLVFSRCGEQLIKHDDSSCSDILEYPQSRKSRTRSDQHGFEKPVELMEHLIKKHSYPGETVVEPFGATGPATRASIRQNRAWLYCEMNPENFKLGSGLISEELGFGEKAAS